MKRRALLTTVAALTTAGCAGPLDDADLLDGSTDTPTATRSPTPTGTSTPTPTATRSPTPTGTSSPTPTATRSPTPTETPTPTANTPTPTATPPPPSEPAKRAEWFIDRARARLGQAVAAIPTTTGSIEEVGEAYEYDDAPATAALDGARADLDTARETASGAQATIIDLLGEYHSAVDGLRAVTGRIPAIHEHVTTAATHLGNDEYADAASSFDAAKAPYKPARSELGAVRATLTEVGPKLTEDESLGLEEFRSDVRAVRGTLAGFQTLYKGGRDHAKGWVDLTDGREQYPDDVDPAEDQFKAAIAHFRDADEWYAIGEDATPIAMTGRITLRNCQNDRSLDAAQHYRGAAQQRQMNNTSGAEDREEKAQTALGRECP